MTKAILLIFLLGYGSIACAQSNGDTSIKVDVSKEFGEAVFVKAEIPPKLKIGVPALEDSLNIALRSNLKRLKEGRLCLSFWVTSDNKITNVKRFTNETTYYPAGQELIGFLKSHPAIWIPAKQNGRIVTFANTMCFEFIAGKVIVQYDQ